MQGRFNCPIIEEQCTDPRCKPDEARSGPRPIREDTVVRAA